MVGKPLVAKTLEIIAGVNNSAIHVDYLNGDDNHVKQESANNSNNYH